MIFSIFTCLYIPRNVYICIPIIIGPDAGVVELVDTLDLGSSAARCGSSSLPACTKQKLQQMLELFYFHNFFNRFSCRTF